MFQPSLRGICNEYKEFFGSIFTTQICYPSYNPGKYCILLLAYDIGVSVIWAANRGINFTIFIQGTLRHGDTVTYSIPLDGQSDTDAGV